MSWNPFKSKPEQLGVKTLVTVADTQADILYCDPRSECVREVRITFRGGVFLGGDPKHPVWRTAPGLRRLQHWISACDSVARNSGMWSAETHIADDTQILVPSRVRGCARFVEIDRQFEIDVLPGQEICSELLRAPNTRIAVKP